ncbi:MAG: hypothetical protein CMJ49_03115, partial [Planctomycetaceae bacterium]|nr:hypothetical protein [Planctomycetaceae bacterium]
MPNHHRTFRCPAKVNLALSVGAPHPDGYHPIASWMITVCLADDLLITPLPTDRQSHFTIDWTPDAPRPSPIDWPLSDDLTVRAHALLEQHVDRALPVDVKLAKRIPVGAGLAGGSSNGAAMLAALDALFDLQLGRDILIDLAMQLGSDLAFFLTTPSAIVTGLGQTTRPAPRSAPAHLALILSDLHCATGAVYRAFDDYQPGATVDPDRVAALVSQDPLPDAQLFNDLAAPACHVEPRLTELRDRCAAIAQRRVHVTGSGAGLFIVARDQPDADSIAAALAGESDVTVVPVIGP